jgi:hypothetical protein
MQRVEIRVKGHIDERWSDWLDGLTIGHVEPNETVLTGPVEDQAALYGLIAKVRDLGLPLSAVKISAEDSRSENDVSCQDGSSRSPAPRNGARQTRRRR